jgi:hypothetical protein
MNAKKGWNLMRKAQWEWWGIEKGDNQEKQKTRDGVGRGEGNEKRTEKS